MFDGISFYNFSGYRAFEGFLLSAPGTVPGAAVERIGESVAGRTIYALRLGAGGRAGALHMSLTHGVEFIGGEMNLAVFRWFAEGGAAAAAILDRIDVYFIFVVNPDAYARAVWQRDTLGAAFARKNEAGVDLNRNFSVGFHAQQLGIWTGLPFRFTPVYRGPEPFSEPETRALRDFVTSHPIKTSISFHSFGRAIGYPYCHRKDPAPDVETLRGIALEMRSRQKRVKYAVMQEYDYVPTSGDMNDWLYEEAGVLPFLIELGRMGLRLNRPGTLFDFFSLSNMTRPEREIDNSLPAVLYLSEWTAERFGE